MIKAPIATKISSIPDFLPDFEIEIRTIQTPIKRKTAAKNNN
jgi:hypothetical protein